MMNPRIQPQELCFPVPKHPHALLHAHISKLTGCLMVHVTTTNIGESAGSIAQIGTFVYAMPDRLNPRGAISTALITSGSSIDYATRLSKILAIRLKQPIYVGCSINLAGTTTEEEIEGITRIVNEIVKLFTSA